MRRRFRATINKVRYRVIETSLEKDYGNVDFATALICIDKAVTSGSKELQTELLLHEALHVLAPYWPEARVLQAGKDLSRLLVTSGVLNETKKTKGRSRQVRLKPRS